MVAPPLIHATTQNGDALQYASDELKKDKEVLMAAGSSKDCENNEEDEEDEDEEDEGDFEEELELEEVVINEIKYLTDDLRNGTIYKCDKEGEIVEDEEGDLIIMGKFNNEKAKIYF